MGRIETVENYNNVTDQFLIYKQTENRNSIGWLELDTSTVVVVFATLFLYGMNHGILYENRCTGTSCSAIVIIPR